MKIEFEVRCVLQLEHEPGVKNPTSGSSKI